MSGHNKWSKVKHKKAAADTARSKVFSKLSRLITSESHRSGGDRNNPSLAAAIEKAKKENMPRENIERAVLRGAGDGSESDERIIYEAYGPGGAAFIIDVLTDNRNRAAQEIRTILKRYDTDLANPGAATWAFANKGGSWEPQRTIPASEEDKKKISLLKEALQESDEVQGVYVNIV